MVLFGGGGGSSVGSETNDKDKIMAQGHSGRKGGLELARPPLACFCDLTAKLTAAKLIRVVGAIHVVVALLVLPDALAVGTGELV